MLLFIYILLLNKPEGWAYAIMICGVTLLIYVAIYYLQRVQYRALYVAEAGAVFWLIYSSLSARRREASKLRAAYVLGIAAAVLCMAVPAKNLTIFIPTWLKILKFVVKIGC